MAQAESIKLTAELVEALAGTFLSPMYDNPQPTPDFHRQGWALYCSSAELAAIAAPRGHAKSTAFTHDYGLGVLLFRIQSYMVIASATEDLAIGHLSDMAMELRDNEDLRREFQIEKLLVDARTEIIVLFKDGYQAKVVAKGSGQKMRGMKWRGKRPGLIIADDLEEDEQVENKARREKFLRWVNRALIPCRRRGGLVRMHGTILHEESVLSKAMRSKAWSSLFFSAHSSMDDFSNILWPGAFTEDRLRAIRQVFLEDGDAAGYSQEYLNKPRDNSEAYLRSSDFLPMGDADYAAKKIYKIGADFAVSKADTANRTSFTVGGQSLDGLVHIVDQRVDRWSTNEWIDVMFQLAEEYTVDEFVVEGGVIWKAVEEIIFREMRERNLYLPIRVINPVKDKAVRARPFQKRLRGQGLRFNKKAEWYENYEDECLSFVPGSEARLDDQFDSTAILVKGFDNQASPEEEDFFSDEEVEFYTHDPRIFMNRCQTTGY
ncbi:MAG TPA: hypothetical protein PL000_18055 [Anaerolineales bacterium]|jgi:phage uncharacterized protein (putative large terminase), C-terminal domain|nr:hypothetical protein [Anaerolineales bacterium]